MDIKLQSKKEKENNREYAYRILHSNIMTLQLPPGSILNEGELSQLLSVSRTPVHEAIIKLQSEYLVNVYPQSASKVSLINVEFLKEGLFLRSIIEPAIIKKIAGLVSSQGLLPLQENLEQQLLAISSEDPINTFFNLDDEFHHLIYDLANKQNTWYSVKSVCSHYDRARYIDAIFNKTDLKDIYNEHKKIYHYVLMGITQEVEFDQFYKNHLHTFDKGFDKLIEHYSQYFII